ncbi:MAG: ATP-binding protein [Myxococcota bacterium]|nr:ATP-binding protein [Myxococcota bacterium]
MSTSDLQADASVLGQLLAAHNVFFVFSDRLRMTQFVQQAIASVPGIINCTYCVPGAAKPRLGDIEIPECATCQSIPLDDGYKMKEACNLKGTNALWVLPLRTRVHHWGNLLIQPDATAHYKPYEPFLINLANSLAVNIERCWQREQLERVNNALEQRTAQLEAANDEIEAFAYSVSHDLRAPLRAIDGFSEALLEDYADSLDEGGKDYLHRVRKGAQHMGRLIDDLLKLSHITRAEMQIEPVDLSALAKEIVQELESTDADRRIECLIESNIPANGDPILLRVALENLLANAWKFTHQRDVAKIQFGRNGDTPPTFYVRDNGAGFDMAYYNKLFGPFQRLHDNASFPGTGIGLATVHRIVSRHGGHIWAEAEVEKGATFYFTLAPPEQGDAQEDV